MIVETSRNERHDEELVEKFEDYFEDYYYDQIKDIENGHKDCLTLDLGKLKEENKDIYEEFQEDAHMALFNSEKAVRNLSGDDSAGLRPFASQNFLEVSETTNHYMNEVVTVKGTVSSITTEMSMLVEGFFRCQCGTPRMVKQYGEDPKTPSYCASDECDYDDFELIPEKSKTISFQYLRLQESPEHVEGGNPDEIDVYLFGNVTGIPNPGERVEVTGIMAPVMETTRSGKLQSNIMGKRINCFDVRLQNKSAESVTDNITDEEIEQIKEIANSSDRKDLIIDSIAPSIYGNRIEKFAAALQLFRGVDKEARGSSKRGTIHVLLVGDPGTGKSQILEYVGELSVRGMYAVGKGATEAGLTATAVQEEDYGGETNWTLKAGVLPLCDEGLAAVDELDKMNSNDRSAMHSALAQQKVSINKGGMNTELRSRTSLLGAANPKHGRFDLLEVVSEQIDLEPPLIARFDLIFIMVDQVEEEKDRRVANHILKTNKEGQEEKQKEDVDNGPAISKDLFRKYFIYARENHTPVLTQDALEYLEDEFIDIRTDQGDAEHVPVTFRQLEGLIRLSAAHARTRLSDEITVEDAEEAVDLVIKSLKQVSYDEGTGGFAADMLESGMKPSMRDKMKKLEKIIENLQEESEEGYTVKEDVVSKAKRKDIGEEEVEDLLDELQAEGEIMQPEGSNTYSTI